MDDQFQNQIKEMIKNTRKRAETRGKSVQEFVRRD